MKMFRDLHQFESLFQNIDFASVEEKLLSSLRSGLSKIPRENRQAVIDWIEAVQKIKADSNVPETEKAKQIESLETGKVVSQFLKSVFDQVVEKIPGHDNSLIQAGLSGLSFWAAAARPEFAFLGAIAIQRLLPKLLNTARGDEILASARSFLKEQDQELPQENVEMR